MLVSVTVAQPVQAALVRPPRLRHRNNRRFHGLRRRAGWTIFEILRYMSEHNWSAYEEALKANPVLAKMMISSVVYSLGDWIAQAFEYFGEMLITPSVPKYLCSSAAVDPRGVLLEFLRPLAARQQMRVWDGGGSNFKAVVYWAYNVDMINDMNRFYRGISLGVTGSLATAETYFAVIVIE
ncbi:hypothetical protein VPH35_012648 [Triticum aestivum]